MEVLSARLRLSRRTGDLKQQGDRSHQSKEHLFTRLIGSVDRPTFERDTEALLAAGKCVAYLIVEFHNTTETQVATAFFINRKHLLTAGHCLYKKDCILKRVQLVEPGISHVDSTNLAQGNYLSILCEVVCNLYDEKDSYESDIALLHTGSFGWPNHMELSIDLPPKGATVDIIGYTAKLDADWMRTQGKLQDIDENLAAVEKLLPKRTLSISRGMVEEAGNIVSYNLSTVPGMSGACVVYKGKAIGIFPCCIC